MRKDLILTAVISAIVASTISIIAVYASGPGMPYPDVDANAYYADAAYTLRLYGVMSGYENGNFGPNDYVTRGQMAALLYRYDQALLGSLKQGVGTGIAPLVSLICEGGVNFDLTKSYTQVAHDAVCGNIP